MVPPSGNVRGPAAAVLEQGSPGAVNGRLSRGKQFFAFVLVGILSGITLTALVGCAAPVTIGPQSPPASVSTDQSPALPVADDLTLGNAAGSVLIGLSVLPAQPGTNVLLVYIAPRDGLDAAASVAVSMTVAGQPVQLATCAPSCRTANVELTGGEHIDVTAAGPNGGTASFDLPALPAQPGGELLRQVNARMHQLRSYQIDETLGPASPPLETSYVFAAPDRMQLTPTTGNAVVWIGPTRYTRDVSSGTWQAQDFGTSPSVPSFIWDLPAASSSQGQGYVGAHIVGTERVDGVDTQVLTFFASLSHIPVWFRLSVGADGLVHQAAMRAQDHFMDHTYTSFDNAPAISPPL